MGLEFFFQNVVGTLRLSDATFFPFFKVHFEHLSKPKSMHAYIPGEFVHYQHKALNHP